MRVFFFFFEGIVVFFLVAVSVFFLVFFSLLPFSPATAAAFELLHCHAA